MEIKLVRKEFTDESTIGDISVFGEFLCYSLEDPTRDEKIAGKTAIPDGRYQVIVNMSPRFKRLLPRLLDVPNYEGILIHTGNTARDTEGCILPGLSKSKDFVGNSKAAFDLLFAKIQAALADGDKVFIEITDGRSDLPMKTTLSNNPEDLRGWDDAAPLV